MLPCARTGGEYATRALADAVNDAYVDRDARKGTLPSDHAPVVVDFAT